MWWPLGRGDDLEERCIRAFSFFVEGIVAFDMVWEATPGLGAAIWVPPDAHDAWDEAQRSDTRAYELTDDGGRRYTEFWGWIESRMLADRLWLLDSIGVAPELQGRGIGRALLDHGLARVRESGTGVQLHTGTPGNVPLYERFGFRVFDDANAPGGGPHVWFMRRDP